VPLHRQQPVEERGTGGLRRPAGEVVGGAEKCGEADVEIPVAPLDEPVGVEDQQVVLRIPVTVPSGSQMTSPRVTVCRRLPSG
jgi:hypothetical protein